MIFLKLGGSLITDKNRAETLREDTLTRISTEIATFVRENPGQKLLLGHGSGSFGHYHASRFNTHKGAASAAEWKGFAEVWAAANQLNIFFIDSLRARGIPAMRFAASSSAVSEDGRILKMETEPIERCLQAGLIPVVHGDVAFDRSTGSTILSTEEIFRFLALQLKPEKMLLAGIEPGVYSDYQAGSDIIPELSASRIADIGLTGSFSTDVTGGMLDKVKQALVLTDKIPGIEIRIFSGLEEGSILDALSGGKPGTVIFHET